MNYNDIGCIVKTPYGLGELVDVDEGETFTIIPLNENDEWETCLFNEKEIEKHIEKEQVIKFNDLYPLIKTNKTILVTNEKDLLIFIETIEDLSHTKNYYVKDIVAHNDNDITIIVYK